MVCREPLLVQGVQRQLTKLVAERGFGPLVELIEKVLNCKSTLNIEQPFSRTRFQILLFRFVLMAFGA